MESSIYYPNKSNSSTDQVALFAGLGYGFTVAVVAGTGIGATLKWQAIKGNEIAKGWSWVKILADLAALGLSGPAIFSGKLPSELVQARTGVWAMRIFYALFFSLGTAFGTKFPQLSLTVPALNSLFGCLHVILAAWLLGIEQKFISDGAIPMESSDSIAKFFQNLTGGIVKIASFPIALAEGLPKLSLVAGFDGFLGMILVPVINLSRTSYNLDHSLNQRME